MTASELAVATGCEVAATGRLLVALTAVGFLRRAPSGRFSLSGVAQLLVEPFLMRFHPAEMPICLSGYSTMGQTLIVFAPPTKSACWRIATAPPVRWLDHDLELSFVKFWL
jgi:hypothetical protein